MGVRFPSIGTSTRITNTIVAGTDTLIVTTSPLTPSLDFGQIFLFWYVILTAATGATAYTLSLRRGALITSTLINIASLVTTAAGNGLALSGCYVDTPGAISGQQYSVSVVPTGASAATTVTDAALIAFAL